MAMCCRLLLPWKLGRGWVQQPLRVSQCDAVCVRYLIFSPFFFLFFVHHMTGVMKSRLCRFSAQMAEQISE